MRKSILVLLVTLFAFGFQAEAQNCNQGENLAQDTWAEWGPWQPSISLNPWKNKVRRIKNVWNAIASNGSATVGPRFLELDGGNETGTILGKTKRTFITPPSFDNRVEVTINKYDGKAKTGVVICTMGRDGVLQQKATYEFPNDRNGKVKKFTLNNVKGKIIIIAMRNKSVGNKFKYRINAKKK